MRLFLVNCFCLFITFLAFNQDGTYQIINSKSMSKEELKQFWKENGIPRIIMPIKYAVTIYDIIYTTTWHDGTPVKASGILMVPEKRNEKDVLSELVYCHGTKMSVERKINLNNGEQTVCAGFATEGYVVFMPDYLGLGHGERFHLYQHGRTEATASIDFIRAGRKLLKDKQVTTNGRLFITGYSQGGHAAMAVHKMIQAQYSKEFNVAASSPMSGAYDISGVQSSVMYESYEFPSYLPYLMRAYDEVYQLIDEDFLSIFQAPYDSITQKYMNGKYEIFQINQYYPKVPVAMFKQEFVDKYLKMEPYASRLQAALKDNDVYDWKPEAPMQLCYCEADEQVKYENAFIAYKKMKANGTKHVYLRSGGKRFDHFACAVFSGVNTKLFFNSIRKGSKKGNKGNVFLRSAVWLTRTIGAKHYIKTYSKYNMNKFLRN